MRANNVLSKSVWKEEKWLCNTVSVVHNGMTSTCRFKTTSFNIEFSQMVFWVESESDGVMVVTNQPGIRCSDLW